MIWERRKPCVHVKNTSGTVFEHPYTKRVGRRVYAVYGDGGGERRTSNIMQRRRVDETKTNGYERYEHRTRTAGATQVVNSERTHGLRCDDTRARP